MRVDRSHESHEDVNFTAEDDEGLIDQTRQHRDEYHREISDEQIREMVSAGACDEEASSSNQARFVPLRCGTG